MSCSLQNVTGHAFQELDSTQDVRYVERYGTVYRHPEFSSGITSLTVRNRGSDLIP